MYLKKPPPLLRARRKSMLTGEQQEKLIALTSTLFENIDSGVFQDRLRVLESGAPSDEDESDSSSSLSSIASLSFPSDKDETPSTPSSSPHEPVALLLDEVGGRRGGRSTHTPPATCLVSYK